MLSCSLYHSLNTVFCPMLRLDQSSGGSSSAALQAGKQEAAVDQQLGELLLDVQARLAKAVRAAAGTADGQQVRIQPTGRQVTAGHMHTAPVLSHCPTAATVGPVPMPGWPALSIHTIHM